MKHCSDTVAEHWWLNKPKSNSQQGFSPFMMLENDYLWFDYHFHYTCIGEVKCTNLLSS